MPIDLSNLEAAIRKSLNCQHIEIEDQSSGCGENYAILLVSEDFEGKSTLARHRWINELLKDEIAQMHAFSQVGAPIPFPPELNDRGSAQKTFTPKQYEAHVAKTQATTD
ncbi:bola protein [Roridomyces roridus]|uniref:Bola protein n=1 Tax=Roridomyces roridus TaxID=1738132 RepID=A0AAD7BJZ8_9AGAR|nr:bola protein [Roridomyces roridus]